MQRKPTVRYLSKNMKHDYSCMLGEVVVLAIKNDNEKIKEFIPEIESYIYKRNCEISRKWQLYFCFWILLSFALIGIFIYNSNWLTTNIDTSDSGYKKDVLFSAFGALGATLSILLKSGTVCYDCEAGKMLNFLEVVSKLFASVICSFIIITLYEIDLIFTTLKSIENQAACIIIMCIIAGFSERLVPSIMSKFVIKNIKED